MPEVKNSGMLAIAGMPLQRDIKYLKLLTTLSSADKYKMFL